MYRWRRQLSALTAGRERRCRRTADRVVALSEHGEPARTADRGEEDCPFSTDADQVRPRAVQGTRIRVSRVEDLIYVRIGC